ncbi:hypothetical protein BJY21_003669 [Kineosphaera limosa]|uniref:General stress protein 17M-like domain-containing protein n=1 Tax=Kineosphaera limosa NBRC 100340 TaxID=1184609 RepID=K6W9W0_9MICO|nr:general stress protein [Kineosphaera limosa]NYE02485.1 hypothetical protein [Kineosphaera limosa]GAB95990.1 hypothetical protein KILIM_030_00320 [Kineosphaera limosa NBRC 100340]
MSTPASPGAARVPLERLALEFPRSLAVYNSYTDAQKAVDYLSDHQFAVENVLIVGTDLKQVERVMGRLTWTKVLTGGVLTGMWLGLFVGLIMSLFSPNAAGSLATILSAVLTGAIFGAVWAAIGYRFTGGRRDFTSVTSVIATKYEVLVEHRLFDQARSLLTEGGLTSGLAAGSSAPSNQPNPYAGLYGAMRTDGAGGSASAATSAAGGAAGEPGGARETEPQRSDQPQYGVRLPEGTPPPQGERRGEGGPSAPPNPRD